MVTAQSEAATVITGGETEAQWVVGWGKSSGWIKGPSVYLQAGETQSELIPGLLLHFRAFIWACSRPSGFGGQWRLGNMGAALCFPATPPPPPPASLFQPPLPVAKGGAWNPSQRRHLL